MVQQASQVFYVKDPTSKHRYVVLHGKKQGKVIDDIENGDPRSFTPMIINKDDNVVDDVHATRKTIMKEFTHEQSSYYGNKSRNIFDNTHLEFYVFVLYDLLLTQIWMTIKRQSDPNLDEAVKDLLD